LVGTPEEFQNGMKSHMTIKKYKFKKSNLSKIGAIKSQTLEKSSDTFSDEEGSQTANRGLLTFNGDEEELKSNLSRLNPHALSSMNDASSNLIKSVSKKSSLKDNKRPFTKQDMMASIIRFKA